MAGGAGGDGRSSALSCWGLGVEAALEALLASPSVTSGVPGSGDEALIALTSNDPGEGTIEDMPRSVTVLGRGDGLRFAKHSEADMRLKLGRQRRHDSRDVLRWERRTRRWRTATAEESLRASAAASVHANVVGSHA